MRDTRCFQGITLSALHSGGCSPVKYKALPRNQPSYYTSPSHIFPLTGPKISLQMPPQSVAGIFNRKQAEPEWTLPYQYVKGTVPGLHHRKPEESASGLYFDPFRTGLSLSPSHVTKSATSALRGGVVTR